MQPKRGSLTRIIVFILILFLIADYAQAVQDEAFITVYENTNYGGKFRELYLQRGRCFPLFGEWADEISSIKLEPETCLRLYENGECEGEGKVLDGGMKRNVGSNLYFTAMNDVIESIQLCE